MAASKLQASHQPLSDSLCTGLKSAVDSNLNIVHTTLTS